VQLMKNSVKILAVLAVLTTSCNSPTQPQANTIPNPATAPVSMPITPPVAVPITALASTVPNPSGQWTFVVTDSSGNEISVDTNTAIRQRNFAHFWQRGISPIPDQNGVSITMIYESMDCANVVWQGHKYIYLDRTGRILNQNANNSPILNVVPGSLGGALYQLACRPPSQSSQADQLLESGKNTQQTLTELARISASMFH